MTTDYGLMLVFVIAWGLAPTVREQAEHAALCARRCARCGSTVEDPEAPMQPEGVFCSTCFWYRQRGQC